MSSFSQRLQKVCLVKKIDPIDLVKGLGQSSSSISKWWNGVITPGHKNTRLLAEFLGCNLNWLKSGTGPMFIADEKDLNALSEKIRQEEGKPYQKTEKFQTSPSSNETEEKFSIAEMLQMTTTVLESKTVYRSALVRTIRAFNQAVQQEEEMNTVMSKLEELAATNKELVKRISKMEEALLSKDDMPAQKRGTA